MSDRCERCDRPSATMVDYTAHTDGCLCERCTSLCWRVIAGGHCEPVDWRARAIRAEEWREVVRRQDAAVRKMLLQLARRDSGQMRCECTAGYDCGLCEVVRSLGIGMRWWSSADIVATLESDRG